MPTAQSPTARPRAPPPAPLFLPRGRVAGGATLGGIWEAAQVQPRGAAAPCESQPSRSCPVTHRRVGPAHKHPAGGDEGAARALSLAAAPLRRPRELQSLDVLAGSRPWDALMLAACRRC